MPTLTRPCVQDNLTLLHEYREALRTGNVRRLVAIMEEAERRPHLRALLDREDDWELRTLTQNRRNTK